MKYTWAYLEKILKNLSFNDDKIKNSNIVIFGAVEAGKKVFYKIKDELNIVGFADNDFRKQNKEYMGLNVFSPDDLKKYNNTIVIIATGCSRFAIKKQLTDMGIEAIYYSEYCVKHNIDKFKYVYDNLLNDNKSKETYIGAIILNFTFDNKKILEDIYTDNQYFCTLAHQLSISNDEVYVDLGAYVGDTVEKFIFNSMGNFKRIYAFEPSKRVYEALNIRKKRLIHEWALNEDTIISENKCVGGINEIVNLFIENINTSNKILVDSNVDGICVEQITLDSYFKNKNDIPTFIKADIEGAEMDMINGAQNIISKYTPFLAICLYHNIEDFFEIPMRIHEINPNYKMEIYHHSYSICETVLYCFL